jgi:hypothetical protein
MEEDSSNGGRASVEGSHFISNEAGAAQGALATTA